MASVLGALQDSTLSRRVDLRMFETGKTTPQNRPLPQGILARLRLMAAWWRLFGSCPVPVAHIHTCSGLTFFMDGLLLLASRLRGAPAVIHIHGARFDAFLDGLPVPARALARWICRRAHAVIVLSPEWRERLAQRLPGCELRTVANGVSVSARAGALHGLGTPCFVFLGNLGQRKGVHVLLEAVAVAREPWTLRLAGGEEQPGFTQWVRDEIQRLGVSSRVQLLGAVVGDAKIKLLTEAQGFVLPSLAEGLPMALLEAMAAGLPVVVSAVGAMPEAVREGLDGHVVPPNDPKALAAAMDDLARAPDQRERFGASAAERCRALYGIEGMVDALMGVYRGLPRRHA
jgi:glycosyltransferase involved in cell wall biosynthesis